MEIDLREILSMIFMGIGTAFVLIAGIGILRMPDLFLRMSMTTKASTFGVGSMLIGTMIYFEGIANTSQAAAILIFVLLTAPISAHMIGRAGYIDNTVKLWERTKPDDLDGVYDDIKSREHEPIDL